jgi:hypothetical protein
MKLRTRDARFLGDVLRLPIPLKQRLELAASHHEDLSIDDIDQLLSISGKRLGEIRYDDKGNPTEAGRILEQLIEVLRYS